VSDFFRFPHTPHLAWLGKGQPRDDKLIPPDEALQFLSDEVVIEEKLDGANLGISLTEDGKVQIQNRGHYLVPPFKGQFSRLNTWVTPYQFHLMDSLERHLIVFGEWCSAKHSLDYDALPDWFIVFDVYDRKRSSFWNTSRRNELANMFGFATVNQISKGRTTMEKLRALLDSQPSAYRQGLMEGIIIRRESSEWCKGRAKFVRSDFTQNINEHWQRNRIEWNRTLICSSLSNQDPAFSTTTPSGE